MKYCVFSAGVNFPENQQDIRAAKAAMNTCEMSWMLEYDACGAYHSKLSMIESFGNISIWIECDSITQLLDDCKNYTYERVSLLHTICGK